MPIVLVAGATQALDLVNMSKNSLPTNARAGKRPSLNARLETVRYLAEINSTSKLRISPAVQHIADALIAAGYTSLSKQAKALGVHRSTAWTIVKTKHKIGRLNSNTIGRILANPETPPSVRSVVEQYLAERSLII
jgi:hypothetical protein